LRISHLAVLLAAGVLCAQTPKAKLWSLQPVARPPVPAGAANPIDAFLGQAQKERGLRPAGPAAKATLLRRVHLDLTGLPPSPADVDAFLADDSPDAYNKVVDRLLADPQHGVRYARHWMDVLAYADVDAAMIAEPGIHLWRDWLINSLNRDTPYDQFARAHIAGDLSAAPDDFFATGFLARAAHNAADTAEAIPFHAVETVSSAFLGMTTACAKCHDHMYDPISQNEYYAMKALFDPLVPNKIVLASAAEIMRQPEVMAKWRADQDAIQARMDVITNPYYQKLYEERLRHLPPDIAAIYRKPKEQRTAAEQKSAAAYEPTVTIDARKFRDVMTPDETARYEAIRKGLTELRRDPPTLPAFWSVKVSPERLAKKNHIYLAGDRTKKGLEVQPGFPFAPAGLKFEGDRRQAFLQWLTAADNPLFARVAVNRIWQWHFGDGIVATPGDFGNNGEKPSNQALLDWLAAEFTAKKYSMKAMHRLIVTSEAYRRDSVSTKENLAADPKNQHLWKYPLRRLDAETVRDSVLNAAGTLDTSIGGRSFRAEDIQERRVMSAPMTGHYDTRTFRRATYMGRGYDSSMNMMPGFLSLFNAEDGHVPCARRVQTITAPQVLFMFNSDLTRQASQKFAERLAASRTPVDLGYKLALGRPPSNAERDHALSYLSGGPSQMEGFAWMLLNLSEFVFLP